MIEEFEHTVLKNGARVAFTQIALGRRGSAGNSMKRDYRLQPRDIIRFDVGCMYEGYMSDIARNFTLEEPDAETLRLFNAVLHGEEVATAALKPGTDQPGLRDGVQGDSRGCIRLPTPPRRPRDRA